MAIPAERSPWECRLKRLEIQFDRVEQKLNAKLATSVPDSSEMRVSHKSISEQIHRVELQLANQAIRLQGYEELVRLMAGVLEAMQVLAAEINAARDGGVQA
jgi:hypothetical protein